MFDKLEEVVIRYEDLTRKVNDPSAAKDPKAFQKLAKEHSELRGVVEKYEEYKAVKASIAEAKSILETSNDSDLRELAEMEIEEGRDKEIKIGIGHGIDILLYTR